MNIDPLYIDPLYEAKVDLLMRVLPHVAEEDMFALKGGTAINLFIWDMPRLSVDIDLTYTRRDDRNEALENITLGLGRIKSRLEKANPELDIRSLAQTDGTEAKLSIMLSHPVPAEIIIEVNTTLKGEIWPGRVLSVSRAVEDHFKKFAAMKVISHQELFGGKICAALDRQHPRDLFDMHGLFEEEGLTEEVKNGFIAILLGGGRPINEMIGPNFLDQREVFDQKFKGMTLKPFNYSQFEETRKRLVYEIHNALTDQDREFLISFKQGEPKWNLFPVAHLKDMPAIRWKLYNIQKLKQTNPDKHKALLRVLEDKLSGKTS